MADSLFDVFSRKENLKALMDKDMTTAEKFVQWVKRFGRQMREAMRRIRMRSPEARAMDEANQQAIKKDLNDADAIVEAYNWLMEEAKEQKARMRDQEGQKRDQEGRREAASGKYSAKPELGEIDSEQNLRRYWSDIDDYFTGQTEDDHDILIGNTPDILVRNGVPDLLLYIHPKEARKIVYPEGYFKGKHNLGFSVLKQMPKQLVDPLIIIKNPQKNRNGLESFGVFTEWITENGERVFAPIQVNAQGAISLQNNLASIFQIKEDNNYLNKLLGDNHQNVVYTKNNESADSLLSHGLIIPQAMRDDAYNAIIPDSTEKGNGKYSLQDTSPANLDEALVQNEVLRKNLYSAWETLAKYRDDKRVVNDPKAIRQLAKRLIEQTQSSYSEKVLSRNLWDIFNGISNARDQFSYQKAMQDMADVAKAVLEKSSTMDNALAEEYADLRRELRTTNISLTDSQKAEAVQQWGDYNTFRKDFMGRLRIKLQAVM